MGEMKAGAALFHSAFQVPCTMCHHSEEHSRMIHNLPELMGDVQELFSASGQEWRVHPKEKKYVPERMQTDALRPHLLLKPDSEKLNVAFSKAT